MTGTRGSRPGAARKKSSAGPVPQRRGEPVRAATPAAPPPRAVPPRRSGTRITPVRRRTWWQSPTLIAGSLVIVVLLVGGFVAIALRQGSAVAADQVAPPAVVAALTQISPQVSSAVGTGGLPQPLKATPPTPILMGPSQKPEVLYIGAGYCPFCAAERWSLIMALGRFGTFTNLHLAQSSGTDVYPNTPTFTFYGSSYQSNYLDFESVEETGQDQQTRLQAPTVAQQNLFNTYDTARYTTSPGGIPFLDLGNQFIEVSSGFSPQVLAGHSWQDITTALANPKATTTQAIVGNANYLTAALCRLTGGQPATVCTAAPIPQIEQQLPAGH